MIKVDIKGTCNTGKESIDANVLASRCYPRVRYGAPRLPICAVVGAGPSLKGYLLLLREWVGDIFAINDTAAYLSDNGIESYLYMIDASDDFVRTAVNIKGAILATRCHPRQFIYDNMGTFDLLEDGELGVEGGPSAPCRAPHLFLRMGYTGIAFFGCDSCFYDVSHLSGRRAEAHENMMVVRCGGKDYLTNASMILQVNYMHNIIRKHPKYLMNFSGGLLEAAIANNGEMNVVAVDDELAKQVPDAWNKSYNIYKVWDDAARI
jgi:hypothetical protein